MAEDRRAEEPVGSVPPQALSGQPKWVLTALRILSRVQSPCAQADALLVHPRVTFLPSLPIRPAPHSWDHFPEPHSTRSLDPGSAPGQPRLRP